MFNNKILAELQMNDDEMSFNLFLSPVDFIVVPILTKRTTDSIM